MSYSYKVEVTTDPYTWTAGPEDPVPLTPEGAVDWDEIPNGYLADPLSVSRQIPEGDFWPAQPAPARASIQIVAESYADVSELVEGLPIQITYRSPSTATGPLEDFAGRIADITVSPHPLGVRVTVVCVDYLADIAEYTVRAAPADGSVYPLFMTMSDLLDTLWSRASIPAAAPVINGFATPTGDPVVAGSVTDGGNLAALYEEYLSQWIIVPSDYPALGVGRLIISQANTGPELDGYYLSPVWREQPSSAWMDTLTLDAGVVDVGGSWSSRKGSGPVAEVEVQYWTSGGDESVTATNPGASGQARATKPVRLAGAVAAQKVADFYVPTGAAAPWIADEFTWRLHADTEGAYVPAGWYGGARLGYPVIIENIAARWCPTGTTYTGVLAGYALNIARGRPTISLSLRPPVHLAP